jgi:hypothetical protein
MEGPTMPMHMTRTHPRLVIALFLVGLLAGWVSLASAAPPGAATLIAPSGVIPNGSVTFTWQAAEAATFYYLQVNDATASPRFTLWYPAGQACPANSATCSVALTTGWGAGSAIWWVQTWNPDGFGPWSTGLRFAVNYVPGAWGDAPASDRFQLVIAGLGVLDKLTGLVWERTPSTVTTYNWVSAVETCALGFIAGAHSWHLPTIEELSSLLDPSRADPALPAGHPFAIANAAYWSATTSSTNPSNAFFVSFLFFGNTGSVSKATLQRRWCVRGGQGLIAQ